MKTEDTFAPGVTKDGSKTIVLCMANWGRRYRVVFGADGEMEHVFNLGRNGKEREIWARYGARHRNSPAAMCAGRAALEVING